MDSRKIYGINIDNTTLEEARKKVEEYLRQDKLRIIATPNTEIVMAAKDNPRLKSIINEADLVIPDGIGLIYASKIKKKPLKERVTGFDLSIKLLEIGNRNGYSIYLLGGKDGVAKVAGENIKRNYPNINLLGSHNGYFDSDEELKIIEEINSKKPDIIFVGLGFPKQDIWINENKDRIKGKVIIGNGGVIDILAGNSKRAPKIFQRLGLEWLYRLIQNPSRIKRQLVLPKFILEVIFKKNIIE